MRESEGRWMRHRVRPGQKEIHPRGQADKWICMLKIMEVPGGFEPPCAVLQTAD